MEDIVSAFENTQKHRRTPKTRILALKKPWGRQLIMFHSLQLFRVINQQHHQLVNRRLNQLINQQLLQLINRQTHQQISQQVHQAINQLFLQRINQQQILPITPRNRC